MSDIFIRRDMHVSRHRWATSVAWAVGVILLVLIAVATRHMSRRPSTAATDMPLAKREAELAPAPSPPPPSLADPAAPMLDRARALRTAGKLAETRTVLYEALNAAADETIRRKIEDLLGEINIEMIFSPHPMDEKVDYIIQRGDTVEKIARRHGTTTELVVRSNQIANPRLIRIGDRLRVLNGTFTIHVSKSRNELELRLNGRFFKRYRIGTGKYDRTPVGRTRVTVREAKPTWWRADGPPLPFGHPENVLGTHWLGLDIKGYGIHGTWEPETIGRHESAGCIRLLNSDIEELYTLVPEGTEVVIED